MAVLIVGAHLHVLGRYLHLWTYCSQGFSIGLKVTVAGLKLHHFASSESAKVFSETVPDPT